MALTIIINRLDAGVDQLAGLGASGADVSLYCVKVLGV